MTATRLQPDVPADADAAERLLDQQLERCRRLDELSIRQAALIAGGEFDTLQTLLTEREAVVAQLAQGHADIEQIRRDWERIIESTPADASERLQERIDDLAEIASRIAARDDADRKAIESQRDGVALKLADVSRSRGALAAYSRPGDDVPAFQDHRV